MFVISSPLFKPIVFNNCRSLSETKKVRNHELRTKSRQFFGFGGVGQSSERISARSRCRPTRRRHLDPREVTSGVRSGISGLEKRKWIYLQKVSVWAGFDRRNFECCCSAEIKKYILKRYFTTGETEEIRTSRR